MNDTNTGSAIGGLIFLLLVPLLQAAGMAGWMIVLLLVPFVNLVVAVMMWAKLCAACGKSPWLVILMFIPAVNLMFFPYLAFSGGSPAGAGYAPAMAE